MASMYVSGTSFLNTTYFYNTIYKSYTVTTVGTAGSATYSAVSVVGGLILRDCAGANRSDSTPSASQLLALAPSLTVGTGVEVIIRNYGTNHTITLTPGAGITPLVATGALNITIARYISARFLFLF